MDPITGAVVAIVLYLFSIPVVALLAVMLFTLAFGAFDTEFAFVGAVVGNVVGFSWAAYAVIQVVMQAINLVSLLA